MVVTLRWTRAPRSPRLHLVRDGDAVTLCGLVSNYNRRRDETRTACKACAAVARRERLTGPAA